MAKKATKKEHGKKQFLKILNIILFYYKNLKIHTFVFCN